MAVLIPFPDRFAAKLFTRNDVPFFEVPTKATIFFSPVIKFDKLLFTVF